MLSKELNLINLNNRKYVHGTSLVRGILDLLKEEFITILDFEIRLRKKLFTQPIINIFREEHKDENSVSIGQFNCDGINYYFNILPSENICDKFNEIDEVQLEKRIYQTDTDWCMNTTPNDDLHVCLNTVSRYSNKVLFSTQTGIEVDESKQTWFVGYKLPTIDFFYLPCNTISISKNYEMLNKTCMKRQFLVDGVFAGERVTIYA